MFGWLQFSKITNVVFMGFGLDCYFVSPSSENMKNVNVKVKKSKVSRRNSCWFQVLEFWVHYSVPRVCLRVDFIDEIAEVILVLRWAAVQVNVFCTSLLFPAQFDMSVPVYYYSITLLSTTLLRDRSRVSTFSCSLLTSNQLNFWTAWHSKGSYT